MPKLSKRFIESEIKPPTSGQLIIRDDELIGFALRITKRSKTFIVEKRVKGKNFRFSIGRYGLMPITEARGKARILLDDMAKGIAPKESKQLPTTVTLREAYEKYISVRPLSKRTVSFYRFSMEKCLSDWLDLPFMSITRDMIECRHQELTKLPTRLSTDGHARANHAMHTLSTILRFASERYSDDGEPLIKSNPVERLTINKQWHKKVVRHGVIPEDKLAAWYRAVNAISNQAIREYFLFVLLTGMRKTETASLKWSDIDLRRSIINVPGEITKTRRGFSVPLSRYLTSMLERRYKQNGSDYVFCSIKDFRKQVVYMDHVVPEIRASCGCNFQIHDLRRTYLSLGAKLEVPFYILKSLVNHKIEDNITDRYLIIDIDTQRKYVELITNEFLKLMEAVDWNQFVDSPSAASPQLFLPLSGRPTQKYRSYANCDSEV